MTVYPAIYCWKYLMSLFMSHLDGLGVALCSFQRSNLRGNCISALEWGLPYSKFPFAGVYSENTFYRSAQT